MGRAYTGDALDEHLVAVIRLPREAVFRRISSLAAAGHGLDVTAKSGTIIPSERADDIVEKIKKYY